MLTILTFIMYSEIDGFGLFSANAVDKGETVWIFNPLIDKFLTVEEMESLPDHVQYFLKKYGSFENNKYDIWLDNTRFLNHSDTPNIEWVGKGENNDEIGVALVDIKAEDEITVKYRK